MSTNRQTALDKQRREGLPTLAVLPIHYPREVLDSLDILGIELWGPPGPLPEGPSDRVQPYVCSLVRNALAFIDAGGIDAVDGILFPNTCDSMIGLASMVPDLSSWKRPVFHFHLPRSPDARMNREFLRGEVEQLWNSLGYAFDRPTDPGRLEQALETRKKIEAAHRKLRAQRRHLPQGERELMELLRTDGWLPAKEHLAGMNKALKRLRKKPVHEGPGVVISGIVPEPMALLEFLEETGVVMVGDDYSSSGRRLPTRDLSGSDPLDVVAARLAGRPPCSTLSTDTNRRMDHLVGLVRSSDAAGVIVHTVRFCEPELFDIPAIKERMEHEGIPVLFIDTEVESELPGPVQTRVEAFTEMIS